MKKALLAMTVLSFAAMAQASTLLLKEGLYQGDMSYQVRINESAKTIALTRIADPITGDGSIYDGDTQIFYCQQGSDICTEKKRSGQGSDYDNGAAYGPKIRILNSTTFYDSYNSIAQFVKVGEAQPATHSVWTSWGTLPGAESPWGFHSISENVDIVDPNTGNVIISKLPEDFSRSEIRILACEDGNKKSKQYGRTFCGGSLKKCSKVSEPEYDIVKEILPGHNMYRIVCEVTRTFWR